MPTTGPQEFKQYLIDYFDSYYDRETLQSNVQSAIEAGQMDGQFGVLTSEVSLLGLPLLSRENSLMRVRQRMPELLVKLRGSKCMLAATADRLLELSNVFAGRGSESSSEGKREGKKNLNLNEILRISSFFGIPWSFLIGGISDHAWYHEATELQSISRSSGKKTSSYKFGSRLEGHIQFGVTVLQSKSINEITITTMHLPPSSVLTWDVYLMKLVHENSLYTPESIPVFTEELLLFQKEMRTYRLIFYRPGDLESRVQLYCRIFTSSTVSVTIAGLRFYNPPKERLQIVKYLNSLTPSRVVFDMVL